MQLLNRLSIYLDKYLSGRVVFAMDLILSLLASAMTLLLANVISGSFTYAGLFAWLWMAGAMVFSCFLFYSFKSYRIVIRHSGVRDWMVLMAVAIGKVLLLATMSLVLASVGVYRISGSLLLLMICDLLLTVAFFFVMRAAMIVVYDMYLRRIHRRQNLTNVLVYGISEKSVSAITRLSNSSHYQVCGFLTREFSNDNKTIAEKKAYYFNNDEDLEAIVEKLSVGGILFATEHDTSSEHDGLIAYASSHNLKMFIIPSIEDINGRPQSTAVREIRIEDLLGRDEIKISLEEIKANFKDKVIMVTGAAGSIGSELVRQLATFGVKQLVLFDNAETPMHNLRLELEKKFPELDFVPVIGDVRQVPRLDYAFRKWRPQVVFHAAAYKHVPLMEENPCEAVLVNVYGSRNVADKCIEYGAEKMVMISTDKAVNPTNIMGCTKRLAEIYVQSLGLAIDKGQKEGKTRFVTTRFGNVLGSNGSVIPRFREQIEAGGPVSVTHPDIVRFFMTIPEACRLVMEAATMSTGNQIFVFDMGKSVKIDSLARKMISLAGLIPDVDIKIEYTGLRPGEKLYEEVLANTENTIPTSHERIRIAKVRDYDYNDAVKVVEKLSELSRSVEIPEMVKLMKEIVPEFMSKNSRFSEYDKK